MDLAVALSDRERERRGLLVGFAAFGGFWGAWSALLPDIRTQTGLEDAGLGLALGAVAVAAVPAMPLAGRLMDRHGAARLLRPSLVLFALAAVVPAFASGPGGLVLALLLLGATTGGLDVLLNTATASWERLEQRRTMAGAHGCFSLGVLVGSVLTGVARDLGAGPRTVLSATSAVLLVVALVQPAYRTAAAPGQPPSAGRRLAPVLLALGLLTAAAFLIEDAVQSWSALHLERTHGAPPWVGGLGPGLFAGAMAAGASPPRSPAVEPPTRGSSAPAELSSAPGSCCWPCRRRRRWCWWASPSPGPGSA